MLVLTYNPDTGGAAWINYPVGAEPFLQPHSESLKKTKQNQLSPKKINKINLLEHMLYAPNTVSYAHTHPHTGTYLKW